MPIHTRDIFSPGADQDQPSLNGDRSHRFKWLQHFFRLPGLVFLRLNPVGAQMLVKIAFAMDERNCNPAGQYRLPRSVSPASTPRPPL